MKQLYHFNSNVLNVCLVKLAIFLPSTIFFCHASYAQQSLKVATTHLKVEQRTSFNRDNATKLDFFPHSHLLVTKSSGAGEHFERVRGPAKPADTRSLDIRNPLYVRGKYKLLQVAPGTIAAGDIVVIASPKRRYVLVYAGEHKFNSSAKGTYSFFIYPFLQRTGLEFNTFPPRFYLSMFQKYGIVEEDDKKPSGFSVKRSKEGVRTDFASYSFGSLSTTLRLWIKAPRPIFFPMFWWKDKDFQVSVYRPREERIYYFVEGVVPLKQRGNTCWAFVTTMLLNWKTSDVNTVEATIKQIGPQYFELLQQKKGLTRSMKEQFLIDAGLSWEYPQNLTAEGWKNLLVAHGPLWVTTQSGLGTADEGTHARILYGIRGDGAGNSTTMYFVNPSHGRAEKEVMERFIRAYEREAATGKPLRIQIVHF